MRATALPCKPYPEQHQLEQRGCPPGSERWLEPYGNVRPRKIVVRDRTRLIDSLSANCAFRFSGTRFLHLLLRRYGSFSLSPRIGLEGRWRRWKLCFFSARQVRHSLCSAHWPRWRVQADFCVHWLFLRSPAISPFWPSAGAAHLPVFYSPPTCSQSGASLLGIPGVIAMLIFKLIFRA